MVQTALETVEFQQFAAHRQGVLILLLTQRQIPTVQTIRHSDKEVYVSC